MMTDIYENLTLCINEIRKKTDMIPETAIVLGSGLNQYSTYIQNACIINYGELSNFPVSTNKMHHGRFIFGYVDKKPVVAMDGRIHYYEGYSIEQVVMPIRLMKMLGAETLILSNAAGGINETFQVGDFMIITDQISSLVPSPLIGPNMDALGCRFPDMSHIYDSQLIWAIKNCAENLGIDMKEGIYLQTSGPNYESPAEIRFSRSIGADAVGMSTACEAVAAVHCGFKVCGISCITNKAAGISNTPLSDEEVAVVAGKSSENFCRLMDSVIRQI